MAASPRPWLVQAVGAADSFGRMPKLCSFGLSRCPMNWLLAAIVLGALAPSHAQAWGSEGHRVVAEIAEQYLEPATRDQVRALLAIENATSLAAVSTWADQVRPQRRVTAPWHYVDIQVGDAKYDAPRDCPANNCLIAKIDEFTKVLADRSAAPTLRLEALKFVVHFIGDLHQPFHVADNHDRGGNEVIVTFNYINNLVANRNGSRFIETFEMEVLKSYFTHVRNQFGHGAGTAPMPNFTVEQTDWAIEFAMIWVRTLVRR